MKSRLILCALWLTASGSILPALGQEVDSRTLLISLDAVPFRVVDEIAREDPGAEARFPGFKGPVPLVSTFPSSTSVALVGLLEPLGLEKSPGYEARFFDWEQHKARGGGAISYSKIDFPWRDFFDWSRRNPAGSAFEAVQPVKSGIKRLRHAIREFADSDMDVSLIYIAATDTAVHVVGPDAVKRLLAELDKMLQEASARCPERPFDTVIFSDHGVAGGPPLINVSKETKKALKAAGFRISKKHLRRPDTVVMTPFGLVSNFEAYTTDDHKDEVARVLAGVDGVELCTYQSGPNEWRTVGRLGVGSIERRESEAGIHWRYNVEGEDPLDYGQVIRQLVGTSRGEAAWMADEDLFQATTDHQFPDAFQRISDAYRLVSNPGSVVCSLGVHYMYGAASTAALAQVGKGKLRWTHGGLNREATLGFLMSDADYWEPPDVARYNRALIPFRSHLASHPNVVAPGIVSDPK